jgi:cell wall-associated NlpC family hydrolase
MTFSGIAAIQAHIQAIEQQVGALGSPAGTTPATSSSPTTGADFASLLTDAMNTQSAVGAGGTDGLGGTSDSGDPSAAAGASGTSLSSLLGEASALTGSNAGGALGPTSPNSSALTSLASALSGGGSSTSTSPDIASLLSSLTGTGSSTSTSPDITSLLSSLTGTGSSTSTSPDITSLLSSLTGTGAAAGTTSGSPSATTQQFLDAALSQQGKPYVWGATASASDPSPPAFDCSELTKWAAARAGVTIPDGAAHQYVWLKQQGATMTVQQALQTPGALLFHFASEPQPGLGSEPPVAHVAISLGNGMTMQAKGHAYGVGVFPAGNEFNYAGMIPGMQ